jgi:hypothetical protein
MGEGLIVRRGGASKQALAPTITFVSKTETQIVFTIKNNDTSTAVILWEIGDTTPDANSFELAADTTSSNITVTGLTGSTEYIVYATANVTGKVKSNVSELSITTDSPPVYTAATGGTTLEYDDGGKRYKSHTFTSNGTFEVTAVGNEDRNQVDYLIIAGGGGGGARRSVGASGGGAGGYLTTLGATSNNVTPDSKVTVTTTSYGVTIGAGGVGGDSNINQNGFKGTNSQIAFNTTIIATGGGGGNGISSSGTPFEIDGGSGAGQFLGETGTGINGQGFDGGTGNGNNVGNNRAGGGGGASQTGIAATSSVAGSGGAGLANILRTGSAETRAGGGGGGATVGSTEGSGGSGGGGNGAVKGNGSAGAANTGGGGGGCDETIGGTGGSGIVVIRYEIAPTT